MPAHTYSIKPELINNDIDLYYQLNINNRNKKHVKLSVRNDIDEDIFTNNENNYNILDYEKLMESIYNDDENDESDELSLMMNNTEIDYNNHNQYLARNNINIKNLKKKKRILCENCNDDNLIEDTSHGILVCKNCGQVVANLMDMGAEWTQYNDDNKKDMNRCSHPISQLLPQSSAATTIAGGGSSRIKTLHGWNLMPYKERSLNEVFKIIQVKCYVGKIARCIEDDAKIMYKNISDCKHIRGKSRGKPIIIRGKNRSSVIAACVLFACRKKDKSRSPKEIADLFGLKHTEITKGCKIFQKLAKLKNIELKTNSTKPEHFIIRFCDELKIKSEFAKQAIQISNNVEKLQIASVHNSLSIATGSIYLMIHINGLAIHKKVIADKFNVSQVTIVKAFKKLEPFMGLLINDGLCDRLSVEIKKYQDKIELADELKPKFIRFNIDTMKALKKPRDTMYNLIEKDKDGNYFIDEKLIVEHNIEIDNKIKQIDNEYVRLNINFTDELASICENELNLIELQMRQDKTIIIDKIFEIEKQNNSNKLICNA